MQCKLIRPAARVVEQMVRGRTRQIHVTLPAGTIVDHPDAYVLCDLELAEPIDDECREAARPKTAEEHQLDAERYDAVEAGIHPEDLDLFKAGKITGYRPEYDPTTEPPSLMFMPGPNWTEADAADIDGDGDGEDDDEQEPADKEPAANATGGT